jgi:hypothetical protein
VDRRPSLPGPVHLSLKLSEFGQLPADVALGQLQQKDRRLLGNALQVGQLDQTRWVTHRNAGEVMQLLVSELLVVKEVAGGMEGHSPSAALVGVNPQGDLLGHGATWHEDGGRLAQQLGKLKLQLLNYSTLPVGVWRQRLPYLGQTVLG